MSGDNDRGREYAKRIIERAKELRFADAFAAPDRQVGAIVSAAQAKATTAMHGRNSRRIFVAFVLAFVVVVLISLCLPYRGQDIMGLTGGVYPPSEVLQAYGLWFEANVMTLFDQGLNTQATIDVNQFATTYGTGVYEYIINRFAVTFLVILIGTMLALAGALFQTTFRNPLAAPTMLGVSDGVTLGSLVFILLGYSSAAGAPAVYVGLVYGLGALAVAIVLGASRFLSGGKRYSVMDMLLLGTVFCQLIGGINQFIQYFVLNDDEWDRFYNVQQATDVLTVPLVQILVIVVFVITFAIVTAYRFRMNLVSFDDDEGTMMGVRVGVLRAGALITGSVMELAAIASIGQVAMLSLAVPFLVRFLMPADFRTQVLGNALVGSLLLLACMVIQHFCTIGFITIPIGAIVSIAVVPFFVWVVTFSSGKWA